MTSDRYFNGFNAQTPKLPKTVQQVPARVVNQQQLPRKRGRPDHVCISLRSRSVSRWDRLNVVSQKTRKTGQSRSLRPRLTVAFTGQTECLNFPPALPRHGSWSSRRRGNTSLSLDLSVSLCRETLSEMLKWGCGLIGVWSRTHRTETLQ